MNLFKRKKHKKQGDIKQHGAHCLPSATAFSDKERAERLAKLLGTNIPADTRFSMWPLPILEKVADRLLNLEQRELALLQYDLEGVALDNKTPRTDALMLRIAEAGQLYKDKGYVTDLAHQLERELNLAIQEKEKLIETAVKHVESHSCTSSCCDAQLSADEAKSLANCLRVALTKTGQT